MFDASLDTVAWVFLGNLAIAIVAIVLLVFFTPKE